MEEERRGGEGKGGEYLTGQCRAEQGRKGEEGKERRTEQERRGRRERTVREERRGGAGSDKLGLRPIGVILRSNQAVKDMGEIHEIRI